MATEPQPTVTLEEFSLMAQRAGLGMSPQELEELKPLYDLYAQYTQVLHSIDLGAEEVDLTFHPDWPPTW